MRSNSRVSIVFVCVLTLALLAASLRSITRTKPVMADFIPLPTIVIDPGHGGIDGGAVSKNGNIVEKDINLAICIVLRDIYVANGFDVIMTRDTDISIHDSDIKSIKKQKTSDLHNRLAIANAQPNTIFISIHQNKFGDSKSKGAQIFYSPNNAQSKVFADILQQDFVVMLQPENHRKNKKAGKNLYLMYEAKCPAVLVECGFISNPDEAVMLTDSEYQSKIAFTIFSSTMRFLGLDDASANNRSIV